MSADNEERMKEQLKKSLPPVDANVGPSRDLWPMVLQRMHAETARPRKVSRSQWVWLDWALLAGLALMATAFPASIPLLLYYL